MLVIIGAGAIGLSAATSYINAGGSPKNVVVIDRYAVPSQGSSVRNSAVLHAGLYYQPGSLKSELCIEGHSRLKKVLKDNKLPLLECGKILVATTTLEVERLEKIHQNAAAAGVLTHLIEYKQARSICRHVSKAEAYLWSPNTCTFSSYSYLEYLYRTLRDQGVSFYLGVPDVNPDIQQININGVLIDYHFLVNSAGAGALGLARRFTNQYEHLSVVPVVGQYLVNPNLNVSTNIYPVPDPSLPFLGIHLTPLVDGGSLAGPNATFSMQKDIQSYTKSDFLALLPNLARHFAMFIEDKNSYRGHILNEISLSTKKRFVQELSKICCLSANESNTFKFDPSKSGVRPQIYNTITNEFENGFILYRDKTSCHVVNAISPALTSSLAFGETLIKGLI